MTPLCRRPRFQGSIGPSPWGRTALVGVFVVGLVLARPRPSAAHDIGLELEELKTSVARLASELQRLERRNPLPKAPTTPVDQIRALGEAEVELALGNGQRALQILLGRLEDPRFRTLPVHVDALLLAAEVLEHQGELSGAMAFAREAMESARAPQHVAEAGARWFRLARKTHRVEDRVRMFELWKSRGGAEASGTEEAAQVMYELGFALRASGRTTEARRVLAAVPPDSAHGSRAAFLAGTLYVQDGDLGNAERWFSSIMDWPLPEEASRLDLEGEVRALAALSTARLRYERGDLDEARAAYNRVPEDSRHRREACWELAFLESERGRERSALKNVECVEALGAPGTRSVDLKLLESSLLAHLNRYAASIEAYKKLHADVLEERNLIAASFERVQDPAEFLFSGYERTQRERGRDASPGPATLLGNAWSPDVRLAYRVDRGLSSVSQQTESLVEEIAAVEAILVAKDAFEPLELRRQSLRRLQREIDHLAGHAGQIEFAVEGRHAASGLAGHDHREDTDSVRSVLTTLSRLRGSVQAQLEALQREAARRKAQALSALRALKRELLALRQETQALKTVASGPVNAVARVALDKVVARLDDAAMRAEVGVLDTYWLKKQHRTRQVERMLLEQQEMERQVEDALTDLER